LIPIQHQEKFPTVVLNTEGLLQETEFLVGPGKTGRQRKNMEGQYEGVQNVHINYWPGLLRSFKKKSKNSLLENYRRKFYFKIHSWAGRVAPVTESLQCKIKA
jgi:hypothetical protein